MRDSELGGLVWIEKEGEIFGELVKCDQNEQVYSQK